jgi:hypothetical protein
VSEELEERAVSTEELRGGLQLAAGHPVVLIVGGGGGARVQRSSPGTTPDVAATAATPDAAAPAAAPGFPASAAAPTSAAKRSDAGWATGATAMSPPPRAPGETLSKPPPLELADKLQNCKFQDGMELDGDTAWLAVKCGGLEGQQIQLVLECEEGGEWKPVASGVSTVKAGEARSGIAIPSA